MEGRAHKMEVVDLSLSWRKTCEQYFCFALQYFCFLGIFTGINFWLVLNLSSLQVEKKMSNNVNKALVIDYSDSRLISCGSLFQGKNSNFVHFLCPLPPLPVKQQREFFQAQAKKLGAN